MSIAGTKVWIENHPIYLVFLFTAPKPINFGRDNVNNCPAFTTTATVEKPDFLPHHLYGNKGRTYFVAEIGQAGSTQGYRALTGEYIHNYQKQQRNL